MINKNNINENSSCDKLKQPFNDENTDKVNKLEKNSEGNNVIKHNDNIKNNNFRRYINEELYPKARNHIDISPEDINIVDLVGDGNYLYRALSRFLYGKEDIHLRIRNEIYNSLLNRFDNLPVITMNTEYGPMRIREYINNIQNEGFYGGELEISRAIELYNINIAA